MTFSEGHVLAILLSFSALTLVMSVCGLIVSYTVVFADNAWIFSGAAALMSGMGTFTAVFRLLALANAKGATAEQRRDGA